MNRILLLTMGDPAGIGPEVTVKARSDLRRMASSSSTEAMMMNGTLAK